MFSSLPFRHITITLAFALFLAMASLCHAQTASQTASLTDSLTAQMNQIEATLGRDKLPDSTFNALREELAQITAKANKQRELLQPILQETQARRDALKPAEPKEGAETEPEAEILTDRRNELETQIAGLDGQLKLLTASLVRAKQLDNKITLARQKRFTQELFDRSSSLFNPTLWIMGGKGLATIGSITGTLFSDWASFLSIKAADKAWQVAGMITIVALLIFGPLRALLFTGLARLAKLEEPTPLQRSLYATWAVIIYTILPVTILWAISQILGNAGLLPTRIEMLSNRLALVIFNISLAYGLIRVLLAPNRPEYRLLNISTMDAQKLKGLSVPLLCLYGLGTLIDETSSILLTPLETKILISGINTLAISILIWLGQQMILSAEPQTETVASYHTPPQDGFALPAFIKMLRPLLWLVCLIMALSPILGYVSLGDFLAKQVGRIFMILALLGILSALIDNFLNESLEAGNRHIQKVSRAIGIGPRAISQFGVLFNGLVRVLLYIAAALLVFAPWGVQSTDFLTSLQKAIFGIQVGDLTISPINILGALLVFFITLVLVKSIQRWMDRRLLPATSLDTGLKNSIQTSVGYVGFILAAMLSFSYMGLDLSNIALVAGALSVGIGFGLQSIVNNFVSGLILLVERPIKTGDWVVVGEDQGYVKKISVRATKIETFDRATVIVPNSDLISNRVMNWMHNGAMGRIIIPVGVSYDSDPEQVRDILLRIAEESEFVSSYPEPTVYFMDFGASSLDFELRCYIQDINYSLTTKSALRFTIFKALKEANIEIPYPQQDVYIRSIATPTKGEQTGEAAIPSQTAQAQSSPPSSDLKKDAIDLNDLADLSTDADGEGSAGNA